MRTLFLLLPLTLVGCATTLRANTVSAIAGCPPSEVVISDTNEAYLPGGMTTFTAQCRGRKYFCSTPAGINNVNCAPEAPQSAAAPSAAGK